MLWARGPGCVTLQNFTEIGKTTDMLHFLFPLWWLFVEHILGLPMKTTWKSLLLCKICS